MINPRIRLPEPGRRVVVRYLLPTGQATDALGELLALDAETVVVDGKRGVERVPRGAIIAAKEVPPPPARAGMVLRPWEARDAGALAAAAQASDDLIAQFGGRDLADEDAAAAYISDSLRFDDHARHWAVVERGTAVGGIGLSAIDRRHETAGVSYWIAASARGRGHATAALIAVCAWAFDNGLYRLELGHRTNNPASCRVAVAAGFLAEGVEREKLRYGDERFDVETHARLRTDPVPARPRRGMPAVLVTEFVTE